MSKNDFFYIGRGFIQEHRGPHKTKKKLGRMALNGAPGENFGKLLAHFCPFFHGFFGFYEVPGGPGWTPDRYKEINFLTFL